MAAVRSVLLIALALLLGAACGAERISPRTSTAVRFEPAPEGAVAGIVQAKMTALAAENRSLLVYVGAEWCEPCKAFHAAANRGELDAIFPGLTLLEFDADKDGARLSEAGYASELIPLFARPGADGRASGRFTQGARKGGDWVADITPRLRALLAP
jgi:hypothetical protein